MNHELVKWRRKQGHPRGGTESVELSFIPVKFQRKKLIKVFSKQEPAGCCPKNVLSIVPILR